MSLTKTFLSIGIAIVLAVFIAYSVHVIYEPPSYYYDGDNPCYNEYRCNDLYNVCNEKSDSTNQSNITQNPQGETNGGKTIPVPDRYNNQCYDEVADSSEYRVCMLDQEECTKEWKKTTERYKHFMIAFYILIVIGLVCIVLGTVFLIGFEGISGGLIGGGILTILWSLIYTTDYWLSAGKWLKLSILAIVLAILIYLAYKRVENRSFGKPKKMKKIKKAKDDIF